MENLFIGLFIILMIPFIVMVICATILVVWVVKELLK